MSRDSVTIRTYKCDRCNVQVESEYWLMRIFIEDRRDSNYRTASGEVSIGDLCSDCLNAVLFHLGSNFMEAAKRFARAL